MCPGGKIVPATPYKETNIVNGMSNYSRDGKYANSAIVSGLNLSNLLKREIKPPEALNWIKSVELAANIEKDSYKAPSLSIEDFINNKFSKINYICSYKPGIVQYDLSSLLPKSIAWAIKTGLNDFNNKLKGFSEGILVGVETKTSSPVQIIRDRINMKTSIENLYFAGEGSGWAGGITSSAADGIKNAIALIEANY
jgi:uncharacterized FAD-dependent dehydrogenase